MMKNILGCACPSAHVSANKLVLSLSDAITPVVWVIDLDESKTILLRVQETENGQFILQKISPAAKTTGVAEDIAVYAQKGKAVRALERANIALSNQASGRVRRSILGCILHWVKWAVVFAVLVLAAIYWLLGTQFGTSIMLKMLDMQRAPDNAPTAQIAPRNTNTNQGLVIPELPFLSPMGATTPQNVPEATAPVDIDVLTVTPTANDRNAVGVPLSADDFIRKQTPGY